MGSSTPDDDRSKEEERRRYFQQIGVVAAENRRRGLQRRKVRLEHDRARIRTPIKAWAETSGSSSTQRSPSVLCRNITRGTRTPNGTPSPQNCQEEAEARREVSQRVRKFREETIFGWNQSHGVTLQQVSLTVGESSPSSSDGTRSRGSPFRRRHQRVMVNRDAREIRAMPEACVNDHLKQSLIKMRENLFQRTLTQAVHERMVTEWSLPQIRTELRRRKQDGSPVKSKGIPSPGDNTESSDFGFGSPLPHVPFDLEEADLPDRG
mmetsp:Transcript_29152/g.77007  ORF Transcript_29152/g.77007 Transcript_29152/m.77007 type:complete len:265 (-) Transcript_29152:40-834(-)